MLPSKTSADAFFAEFGDPEYDPFKLPTNMGLQTCVRPVRVVPLKGFQPPPDPRRHASSSSSSSVVQPAVPVLQHKAELKMVEQSMKLMHDIDLSMMQTQLEETTNKYKLAAALLEHAHFSKPAGPCPTTPTDHPPTQSAEQHHSSSSWQTPEDLSQSEKGWAQQEVHQEEWREEEWHQDTQSEEQWSQEEWRQKDWLQDEWREEDWNQDDWHEEHGSKQSARQEWQEDDKEPPKKKQPREAWRVRGGPNAVVIFQYVLFCSDNFRNNVREQIPDFFRKETNLAHSLSPCYGTRA